jgi:hypothetical protein
MIIFRDFCSIPATSASSERAFSQGGRIITSTRTRLSMDTMNLLMLTKLNLPRVSIREWTYKEEDPKNDEDSRNLQTKTAASTVSKGLSEAGTLGFGHAMASAVDTMPGNDDTDDSEEIDNEDIDDPHF